MNDTDDSTKPLDELLKAGSTLMVGTSQGVGLEFHPMTVARVRGSDIEILLDTNEVWVAALTDGDPVTVTMSDTRANTWLWFTGSVTLSTDAELIDELWNPFAEAYFDDGRQSSGIAVMRIDGDGGRYWTSPSGRIGSLVSFVKAKFGDAESSGEHGDVAG